MTFLITFSLLEMPFQDKIMAALCWVLPLFTVIVFLTLQVLANVPLYIKQGLAVGFKPKSLCYRSCYIFSTRVYTIKTNSFIRRIVLLYTLLRITPLKADLIPHTQVALMPTQETCYTWQSFYSEPKDSVLTGLRQINISNSEILLRCIRSF